MRVRKRGESRKGNVLVVDGLGSPPETRVTTRSVFSDEASIIDEKHPDFFESAKAGKIVMGACSIDRHNLRNVRGTVLFEPWTVSGSTWTGRSYEGDIAAYCSSDVELEPQWFRDDILLKESEVVNKAFSKAYTSTATLLVTAAELKKTVAMVNRPFANSRTLLWQVTRRYRSLLSKGIKVAEAASQAWLEYRLGWKPILYDLQNIGKAVENVLTRIEAEQRAVYRSGMKAEGSWSSYVNSSALSPASTQLVTTKDVKYFVSAGVILKEMLYPNGVSPTTKILGLQLQDVAPTVWELIPYSFVVDRFVAVQTWIEAIQPRPHTAVEGSWQTTVRNATQSTKTIDMTMTVGPLKGQYKFYRRFPADSIVDDSFSLIRKVGVAPTTLPTLVSRDLNLNQHADHCALILGQVKGLFPELNYKSFGIINKRK